MGLDRKKLDRKISLEVFLNIVAVFHTRGTEKRGQLCLLTLPFHFLVCHGAKKISGADYIKDSQHLKQQFISEFEAKTVGLSEIMIAYKPLNIALLYPPSTSPLF